MHFARQTQSTPTPSAEYCAENNKGEILGITGSFSAFAIVIVVIRLLVRSLMIRSVGADDYAISVALSMAIATLICFVYETKHAVGRHSPCLAQSDYEMFSKWQYYHSLWVMIGVVVVKISIALFLMRLVPPGRKWKGFLWAVIGMSPASPFAAHAVLTSCSLVFLVCFCLTCLGTLIFQCTPIAAAWDFSIRAKPSTDCFSNDTFTAIGLFNSIINCITDFLLAVVPIPLILKLQVNTRTKLSLALILSLGYFACAAGIVKAIKQHNFFQEKDPLWSNSFNVWNMIELCVGIIAASLPALRLLFAKILESSKHAFSGSWPGSKGSKNRTIGSSGHRKRKSEDIDFLVGKEFQLNAMGGSQRSANLEIGENSVTPPSRPGSPTDRMYTVAITAGNKPSRTSAGSAESYEGLVPGRNESKEPLTRPDAIYKKTEVVSLTSSRSR